MTTFQVTRQDRRGCWRFSVESDQTVAVKIIPFGHLISFPALGEELADMVTGLDPREAAAHFEQLHARF